MMKRFILGFLLVSTLSAYAQPTGTIPLAAARFQTGDNNLWASDFFDDSGWKEIRTNETWEKQGFPDYDGYAWYRIHFSLPASLRESAEWKDSLRFFLGRIDDVSQVFLNGSLLSQTGTFPSDGVGYGTAWNTIRDVHVSTSSPFLHWDRENILAIKVYDGGGPGGMFGPTPYAAMMDLIDGVVMTAKPAGTGKEYYLNLQDAINVPIKGVLRYHVIDELGHIADSGVSNVTIVPNFGMNLTINIDPVQRREIQASFTEQKTGRSVSISVVPPYILTPPIAAAPRINCAAVFGVRPGSPFLFRIAATGRAPLKYSVLNLPKGLTLDPAKGIITGKIPTAGKYEMDLVVSNASGAAKKHFVVSCGNAVSLTPPMGWNSWNCWGLSVSDAKVRSSAWALLGKGLVDHGWTYMNIDDGWEASARQPDGKITANEKFPDMRGLGDWLHSNGLKFGIYSSPGKETCGGYLGSYQHELQDAATYNDWGVDYLKYDWCSYEEIHAKGDTSLASYKKPYEVMRDALRAQSRDFHYSLCQYGMKDVWKWGHEVDGNSWRTTGDINDSWESLKSIAFSQDEAAPYSKPGRWNDPDMLVVGQLGWSDRLHPSRLNPDEQYAHISMWCLLSAPLLIGCDISQMDDFTLNLLTNDEVISIDQDPLGRSARKKVDNPVYQVWVKEMSNGKKAIGFFNLSETFQVIRFPSQVAGLSGKWKLRDCWRQKDIGLSDNYSAIVPPHGVVLLMASR